MGGASKPALRIDGQRLLDIALQALQGAGRRIVVGGEEPLPEGVLRVCEQPPGGGPVAALAAALPVLTADVCVVLAADLPFVTPRHVHQLLTALDGEAAVAVDDVGHEQPLLAAYRVDALRRALPPDPAGTAMRALRAGLRDVRTVRLDGTPSPWFDCDTPEQLDSARAARRGP